MTGEPIDRLDPDIAELLRAAEPYPDAPHELQARVAAALARRIASSNTPESSEGSANAGGAAAAPKTSGIVALGARPLRTIAGTFLMGAAVGATVLAFVRPPRERIIYVEKRPLSSPMVAQPEDVDHVAPPIAAPTIAPAPSVRRPPVASGRPERSEKAQPRGASDLGAEQLLLDIARRALVQGNADDALAPLDRHEQRYPDGILAEEREALAVNVFVSLGRYADARTRGERFFQRYPGSLLRASVEAALGAIPR